MLNLCNQKKQQKLGSGNPLNIWIYLNSNNGGMESCLVYHNLHPSLLTTVHSSDHLVRLPPSSTTLSYNRDTHHGYLPQHLPPPTLAASTTTTHHQCPLPILTISTQHQQSAPAPTTSLLHQYLHLPTTSIFNSIGAPVASTNSILHLPGEGC